MSQDPESVLSLRLQYKRAQANKLQQLALQINSFGFPYFTWPNKIISSWHKNLSVVGCPVAAARRPPSRSCTPPSSAGQGEKRSWGSSWVEIKARRSLTDCHHRQNGLSVEKINLLLIRSRLGLREPPPPNSLFPGSASLPPSLGTVPLPPPARALCKGRGVGAGAGPRQLLSAAPSSSRCSPAPVWVPPTLQLLSAEPAPSWSPGEPLLRHGVPPPLLLLSPWCLLGCFSHFLLLSARVAFLCPFLNLFSPGASAWAPAPWPQSVDAVSCGWTEQSHDSWPSDVRNTRDCVAFQKSPTKPTQRRSPEGSLPAWSWVERLCHLWCGEKAPSEVDPGVKSEIRTTEGFLTPNLQLTGVTWVPA